MANIKVIKVEISSGIPVVWMDNGKAYDVLPNCVVMHVGGFGSGFGMRKCKPAIADAVRSAFQEHEAA